MKELWAGAAFVFLFFMFVSRLKHLWPLWVMLRAMLPAWQREASQTERVHHLLQLVHKHTLLSWSPICRHHADKVTIKRYWNKINGDGGGGRTCGCVLQEGKKLCRPTDAQHKHACHACVHMNTHIHRNTHSHSPPIFPLEQGPWVPPDATSAQKI